MGRGYGDSLTIYNLENDEKTVIPSEDKKMSVSVCWESLREMLCSEE